MKEEIEARNVFIIGIKFHQSIEDDEHKITDEEDIIFNTKRFNQRLVASVRISGNPEIAIKSTTRKQQRHLAKLVTEKLVKDIHIDTIPEPPKNPTDTSQPRAFLSAQRNLNTTTEELSKLCGISVLQAALTLKATTQKLVQSAIMPLSCIYRADHMFNIKRLQCTIARDTMHAKVNSIHREFYCKVFGNN